MIKGARWLHAAWADSRHHHVRVQRDSSRLLVLVEASKCPLSSGIRGLPCRRRSVSSRPFSRANPWVAWSKVSRQVHFQSRGSTSRSYLARPSTSRPRMASLNRWGSLGQRYRYLRPHWPASPQRIFGAAGGASVCCRSQPAVRRIQQTPRVGELSWGPIFRGAAPSTSPPAHSALHNPPSPSPSISPYILLDAIELRISSCCSCNHDLSPLHGPLEPAC